jgi:hypothetical protein
LIFAYSECSHNDTVINQGLTTFYEKSKYFF